jgi:hypothetical protein
MREKSVKKGWLGDTASNHYRQVGLQRTKVVERRTGDRERYRFFSQDSRFK